jgi:hypothetical protein
MKKLHLGEETTTEAEEKHWELFLENHCLRGGYSVSNVKRVVTKILFNTKDLLITVHVTVVNC